MKKRVDVRQTVLKYTIGLPLVLTIYILVFFRGSDDTWGDVFGLPRR